MKQLRTIGIALFGLALMVLAAGPAFAVGTSAGTSISNQATLSYSVGSVAQPVLSSDSDGNTANGAQATTFLVDNRVDLTMTGGNNLATNGNNQILIFTLTNTGNSTQGFDLDLFVGTNSVDDDIDMNNVRVYIDVNNDGFLDGGDTLYSPAGTTNSGDLAANATRQFLVVADTQGTATNGQTADYSLVATTLNAGTNVVTLATVGADTAAVDIALGDGLAGGGVGGAVDAANNGKFLATGTYTIQTAQLTVAKAALVISDPINLAVNPKAIPGAVIEYTIDITNTGAAAADALVLTDPVPTNTDFMVGSTTAPVGSTIAYDCLSAGTFTCSPAAGGNGADPNVSHVRVSIPTVAAAGSAQVVFRVVIE